MYTGLACLVLFDARGLFFSDAFGGGGVAGGWSQEDVVNSSNSSSSSSVPPISSSSSIMIYYYYMAATAFLSVFLLSLAYLPHIFHRPALVDAFCADVLSITVHAACISVLSDPLLRHACALHSACFCIQNRFLGGGSSSSSRGITSTSMMMIQPVLLVHTILVLLLLSAYVYGPRLTEIRQFVISAVCPHVLELGGKFLASLHGGLVTFWLEKGT